MDKAERIALSQKYGSKAELQKAQEAGGGLCSTCQRKLEFYYVAWCAICEKPKLEPTESLNIMKAFAHLNVIEGNTDLRERLWGYICENDLVHNDCMFHYCFLSLSDKEWDDDWDEQRYKDDQRLKEVFDLKGDAVLLDVAW